MQHYFPEDITLTGAVGSSLLKHSALLPRRYYPHWGSWFLSTKHTALLPRRYYPHWGRWFLSTKHRALLPRRYYPHWGSWFLSTKHRALLPRRYYPYWACNMNRQTCFLLLGRTLWITTRQNRLAVTCCELLLCTKEPRHQEVKQGPQLQHIVLYWSSWQNEPVVCNQQLDCFWGLPEKWEKLSWDFHPVTLLVLQLRNSN